MSGADTPRDAATPTPTPTPATKPGWREALRVYAEPAALRMLALGFSAGLPLLLVLGTLAFRLREAGIDRATIGYLSWVGLAYGFKWVWAPLVDRVPLPGLTRLLGRRRSGLLLAQAGVIAGLVGMAMTDPRTGLQAMVGFALLVAFSSATQDIALDAFRIESAASEKQGALAATYQSGYRIAMICAGAGVLWIAGASEPAAAGPAPVCHPSSGALSAAATAPAASAAAPVLAASAAVAPVAQAAARAASAYSNAGWQWAYLVMAALMVVGVLTVLTSREPARVALPPARSAEAWLREALIEPFADFFRRHGWHAALILALISIYRISDVVMGIMANPFYVDMCYTKDEVAAVTKIYGVIMTLAGAFIGGALSLRFGVMRILMLGAVLSALSNLLFAWLAGHGHDLTALIAVVSADNLSGGIASAAFVAYLSGLTNVRYSATQYALFSSLMLMLPKTIAGFSGAYVDAHGYAAFFTGTAMLGLPVLVLVALATRLQPAKT